MGKHITFSVGGLCFIDILHFLQGSPDSLVSATPKESLKIPAAMSKGSDLLYKKGVIYPYEYMDSWDKFSETRLPAKDEFYSKLNDEHITDEEYARTQIVCEVLSCKNLGDYHDLYVETDVALLADVLENFRKIYMPDTEWIRFGSLLYLRGEFVSPILKRKSFKGSILLIILY